MTGGTCHECCALPTFPNFFAFIETIYFGPNLKCKFYTKHGSVTYFKFSFQQNRNKPSGTFAFVTLVDSFQISF
jgi:hypothetical protein